MINAQKNNTISDHSSKKYVNMNSLEKIQQLSQRLDNYKQGSHDVISKILDEIQEITETMSLDDLKEDAGLLSAVQGLSRKVQQAVRVLSAEQKELLAKLQKID